MAAARRPVGAATAAVSVAAAFALAATGSTPAAALQRPDFPSWGEVQAAKQSEAAKKAEIEKIQGLVAELQTRAAELGTIALQKGEDSRLAQSALEAATAKTERLQTQLTAAQKRADDSAALASRIVARLARTGGGDTTLALAFSSEGEADDLLSRLSRMTRLGESSTALVQQAVFDKQSVEGLAEEAKRAEKERRSRADEADAALVLAQQAAADAEAQVAAQQAASAVLYAQLASLKGTTATLEQQYQEGVAWEAAQAAQPKPPAVPSQPAPGVDPTPSPPSSSAVEGAIAFARAQIGKPYGNSMGPNSYDCAGLVKTSYASVGVYVGPWGSTSQYNYLAGQNRLVAVTQLQAGDLLFYSTGGSTSGTKYHVTMYLGGGQMIEAPYPGLSVRVVPIRYGDLVPYVGRPTG